MAELDNTWLFAGAGLLALLFLSSKGGGGATVISNLTPEDVAVVESNNALTASLANTQAAKSVALTQAVLGYKLGAQTVSAQYLLGSQTVSAQEKVAMTNLADSYSIAQGNQALEAQALANQAQAETLSFKLSKLWATYTEWVDQAALATKSNISGNAKAAQENGQWMQMISTLIQTAGKAAAAYFAA